MVLGLLDPEVELSLSLEQFWVGHFPAPLNSSYLIFTIQVVKKK